MSGVIYLEDSIYPPLLREIDDPPKQLFYKGVWDSHLFESCLAVVGSRRMTEYGKQVVMLLVKQIVAFGVTIVSGFMYGIDAEAHTACLDAGGRTIAVMPGGIDLVTPSSQHNLYNRILSNDGLIISEYDGSIAPQSWSFPRRNRIVAGLSRGVLVVEATLNSGSLITARYAEKYGRPSGAVPASILSEMSVGSHQMIKEGAYLVNKTDDILNMMGKSISMGTNIVQTPLVKTKNPLEEKIIGVLKTGGVPLDVLCRSLTLTPDLVCTTLSYMTLRGLIKEEEGKYYVC